MSKSQRNRPCASKVVSNILFLGVINIITQLTHIYHVYHTFDLKQIGQKYENSYHNVLRTKLLPRLAIPNTLH